MRFLVIFFVYFYFLYFSIYLFIFYLGFFFFLLNYDYFPHVFFSLSFLPQLDSAARKTQKILKQTSELVNYYNKFGLSMAKVSRSLCSFAKEGAAEREEGRLSGGGGEEGGKGMTDVEEELANGNLEMLRLCLTVFEVFVFFS